MKLNFDELDIMWLDLQSLTPEQRSALVQWAVRRAHAERARALAEMWAVARSWLRSAASVLVWRASPLNGSLHLRRQILAVAAVLSAASALAVDQAAAGKVPGLHIHPWPPSGYGKPRVPRVVRNFNPKQHVRSPKKDIGLARRR